MISATYCVESGGANEDRLLVERRGERTIAIICDGAGNGGRGGLAAEFAIGELARVWREGLSIGRCSPLTRRSSARGGAARPRAWSWKFQIMGNSGEPVSAILEF